MVRLSDRDRLSSSDIGGVYHPHRVKGWCSSCASGLADKSISGERFTVIIDKEIYSNVRHAVVAGWTTWELGGMDSFHDFRIIILYVGSNVMYNSIGVRDILHRCITSPL